MTYGLGIDLGTTFTTAAVSSGGEPRMVPLSERQAVLMRSVVRIEPDHLAVAGSTRSGSPAIAAHRFRRHLGDSKNLTVAGRTVNPAALLTTLLANVLDRVAWSEGAPPDQVVLTCPAVWGPYRREQLIEIARRAGLARHQVTVVSEAEAVTAHHLLSHPLPDPALLAVYDLGGGSFDATLTYRHDRGTGGAGGTGVLGVLGVPESLEWFGGVDLDELILRQVDETSSGALSLLEGRLPEQAVTMDRVRQACVRAKEKLSTVPPDGQVLVQAPLPGQDRPVRISRAQLEGWTRPYLEAGLPSLRRAFESAGVHARDLSAVLLVGGMAHVPLVVSMLTDDLGRPPYVPSEPQQVTALGAAALAASAS
ncbi:Hsp70 family protein [Kineosporia sp. J2-2]|uniref:Hsp70 family protein n=1 Tax=Kineosporia corallincola TaxID=2835133 RepID=A0ABS5THF7_9ACTN|nr:Hsp70 family protein [Kineosporia corallincola]MBT0769829.1 Hsp70 family protein [Kineosporia corallincola]